ncbi:sugar kinase [Cohnella candidum]|uniref:Sugar kinase n=1 Tax=Cohnella candidum TaxID=2674991 RepID=A0A3G3K4E3_9BACL|nr:sugar kinase [Cohnella candidum]AYQ74917.1 sugar kinase [Cohnella candidum]
MNDIVTLGESMVVFDPSSTGPLRHVSEFKKHMAGAESNVAIGLARLGHRAGWLSRVGDDEFGRYITGTLKSEGIDVSRVIADAGASTGVMFKERRNNRLMNVYYYRSNSAASRLCSEDVDKEWIRASRMLHVTGITPALSDSCHAAVCQAIRYAREAGVPVSFDLNLRLKLWDADKACETLLALIPECTYFLPGYSEGRLLTGIASIEDMARYFHRMGPEAVVIKDGKKGAYLYDRDGGRWIEACRVEEVADPIGAGDAFAAGFLSGVLKGQSHAEAVMLGNVLGSYAVTIKGDWEGLPDLTELECLYPVEDTVR